MRRALALVLLFAVLLPSVSPWGTIARFHLNREYIARVLCQNRDKPRLHCDGQCYLAKKLAAEQRHRDQETTERVRNLPLMQWCCAELTDFTFADAPDAGRWVAPNWTYRIALYGAPRPGVFQPPRA